MRALRVFFLSLLAVIAFAAGYYAIRHFLFTPARTQRVLDWLRSPGDHAEWAIQAKTQCPNAPFILPTDGFIGYLWGDAFNLKGRHQGIDIFGGAPAGQVPIYSVYDGYLTRESDWRSAVILRIPQDPLTPGRQIWVYFAHMADPNGNSYISKDFPPGTTDLFIPSGTLLGYQGNFSGDPNHPTGVHLHLSIVLSNADGSFKNELEIINTVDPSPYFGLPLNANMTNGEYPECKPTQ